MAVALRENIRWEEYPPRVGMRAISGRAPDEPCAAPLNDIIAGLLSDCEIEAPAFSCRANKQSAHALRDQRVDAGLCGSRFRL